MELGGLMGAEYCMEQHYRVLKFSFDVKTSKHSFAYCCCEQASHEGTGILA